MKKVEEIISKLGAPAAPQPISNVYEMDDKLSRMYYDMYAESLNSFFETSWFLSTDDETQSPFRRNTELMEKAAGFLHSIEFTNNTSPYDQALTQSVGVQETWLVWTLCRLAIPLPPNGRPLPPPAKDELPTEGDPMEIRYRMTAFEALLSGVCLPVNQLASTAVAAQMNGGVAIEAQRKRQFDFWHSLGALIQRPADPRDTQSPPSASHLRARDEQLADMRRHLDGRENRDVLYSIAVIRELGPRFPGIAVESGGVGVPSFMDEKDPCSRLIVAVRYLKNTASPSGGNTNVVRRLAAVALKAYDMSSGGINISRH